MKKIIITCGTSILNSKIIDTNLSDKIDEIENDKDLVSNFTKFFLEEDYKKLSSIKKIKNYGAEINLLKKVYKSGDKIYLFFSETNGGEIVKSILKGYFKTKYAKKLFNNNNFNIKDVNFIIINGFSVKKEKNFKEKAIPDFFIKLEEIKNFCNFKLKHNNLSEDSKIETIMCPIGGYKALIPYASLYAMVNGWDIKYLYEDSEELINLPSGALTNLTGELILNNNLNIDIFKNIENLGNNYNYKNGLELSIGIRNFIEYGKSKELANICNIFKEIFIKDKNFGKEKQCFEKLGKYLINLSEAFDLIRLNDIKKNINSIVEIDINAISNLLIKNSIKYLQDELHKIDISYIIKWYFNKGRYAESILIMREGIIDYVGKKLEIQSYNKKEIRLKIENTLQLFKYITKDNKRKYLSEKQEEQINKIFEGNKKFFEKLTNKRNNFAHINNESLINMKKGIEKIYEDYNNLTN